MMKKGIVTMMAVVMAASAQAQFYAKAGVGAHLPAASQVIGYNSTTTEDEVIKGTYGKGIAPVIGVGYMVTPHVGLELGASFLLGGKYKATHTNQNSSSVYEQSAKSFFILPAVVLKAGEPGHKIRPYGRAGLIIAPTTKYKWTESYVSGNNKEETTIMYKARPSLGFTGSLGLEFAINKMASIWVEAVGNSISTWMKSGEITEYTVNGTNELASVPNKTWKYEDKLPNSNNVDMLSSAAPLNSIGLAVGVAVSFGK